MRLPVHLRHWLLASAPLLAMLLVLFLALGPDLAVASFFKLHRGEHPFLAGVLKLVTNWGNYCFYAWFLWLLYRAFRTGDRAQRRFVLVYIAAQLAIALVAVRLLKITIGRPRPGEDGGFQAMSTAPSNHSLPSGHTTEAVGSAMSLALRSLRLWTTLGLGAAAALVAFSRIYLGWHYPVDVLCGWMLGSVIGLAVTLFAPAPRPTESS